MCNSVVLYGYKVPITEINLQEKLSRFIVGDEYKVCQINEKEAIVGLVIYNSSNFIGKYAKFDIPDRNASVRLYSDISDLFSITSFDNIARMYAIKEGACSCE